MGGDFSNYRLIIDHLVPLMESRQIDVLAIDEYRIVFLDPNEGPTGAATMAKVVKRCGKGNLSSVTGY